MIFTNKLPHLVEIGGVKIEINTDFRFSITFEELTKQYDLEENEQKKEFLNKGLKIYYPVLNIDFNKAAIKEKQILNHIADNINDAIDQMLWFFRCGRNITSNNSEGNNVKEEIYNFTYDEPKIFSSFMQQYKINIRKENIHWWDFKALFDGLDENTEIKKVISIRSKDLTKITDRESRETYRKLKKIYRIPRSQEETEEDAILGSILLNGGNLSQLRT